MDEPQQVQDYWGLVSRVGYHSAPSDRPAGRADVAAVITVEHLELLPELLAQQEAERLRSIGRRWPKSPLLLSTGDPVQGHCAAISSI